VILTDAERYVETLGAYARRPNAIDARWRNSSHFE
jgi:hypothetical protein